MMWLRWCVKVGHTTGAYVPYSFWTVVWVLLPPARTRSVKVLWDGTYGFLSLSEKTRKSNCLQMSLQRQHFLLIYFKTPSVGSARFEPATSCSADWCSPNWANKAAVNLLLNYADVGGSYEPQSPSDFELHTLYFFISYSAFNYNLPNNALQIVSFWHSSLMTAELIQL